MRCELSERAPATAEPDGREASRYTVKSRQLIKKCNSIRDSDGSVEPLSLGCGQRITASPLALRLAAYESIEFGSILSVMRKRNPSHSKGPHIAWPCGSGMGSGC